MAPPREDDVAKLRLEHLEKSVQDVKEALDHNTRVTVISESELKNINRHIAAIEKSLERHDTAIFGNGKEGLQASMTKVNERLSGITWLLRFLVGGVISLFAQAIWQHVISAAAQ